MYSSSLINALSDPGLDRLSKKIGKPHSINVDSNVGFKFIHNSYLYYVPTVSSKLL